MWHGSTMEMYQIVVIVKKFLYFVIEPNITVEFVEM